MLVYKKKKKKIYKSTKNNATLINLEGFSESRLRKNSIKNNQSQLIRSLSFANTKSYLLTAIKEKDRQN